VPNSVLDNVVLGLCRAVLGAGDNGQVFGACCLSARRGCPHGVVSVGIAGRWYVRGIYRVINNQDERSRSDTLDPLVGKDR